MAYRGVERRLPFVSLPDADQVIGVSEVRLCEHHCSLEQLKGRRHQREGVPVLFGDVVQAPVVYAWLLVSLPFYWAGDKGPLPAGSVSAPQG